MRHGYQALLAVGLFLAASFLGLAPTAHAQNVYYAVDYMKTSGDVDEYLAVEQELWKPVHQARVDAGTFAGWFLYAVEYPYGTETEYDYVTVNVYTDLAQTREGSLMEMFAQAHPGENHDAMLERTDASRDMVRGELWRRVERVSSDTPVRFLHVSYMKTPPGGGGEYVAVERDIWKPIHQARVDAGKVGAWEVSALIAPGGTEYPYNYGVVNGYAEFADFEGSFSDDLFKQAHPEASDADMDAMMDRTGASRQMVRTQIWRLVDFVQAEQ